MEWYDYFGIILGILSIFFGFTGFFLYMKIKKFLKLINEEQMEEATPIINEQTKRVKINLLLCFLLGVIALIILFI